MPYSPAHKEKTRGRILESARQLFNRRGFSDVTIEEIMANAELTHGGFYKHFKTKEDLYAEAILQFGQEGPACWQMAHIDPSAKSAELARMIVNAYLSQEHQQDRDGSCPMIALPSDVARGQDAVKAAYQRVLEMMVAAFEGNINAGGRPPRQAALALASMCVGGMVLARAVSDPALADEIRAAARTHILEDAGWL